MSGDSTVKVTFLGTGSSSGVPAVGIGWGRCNPDNPKNTRLRQSILIETAEKRFLVDTTPDLRTQLLNEDVNSLDAVLFTHPHADHLHGIDELRGITRVIKRPLPVFADPFTHEQIRDRFAYTILPATDERHYYARPVLEMHEFTPGDDLDASGVAIGTFRQDHGFMDTVGFQIGSAVYSTDLKALDEDVFERLEASNLDLWIIGTFRWDEHWTHAHVERAMQWIDRVKPKRAILTHLGPDLDYDELSAETPDHVSVAFDGMTVEIAGRGGEISISD